MFRPKVLNVAKLLFRAIKYKIRSPVKEDTADAPPAPVVASRRKRKGEVLDIIVIGVGLIVIIWMILYLYNTIVHMSEAYFDIYPSQ